MLLLTNSALSPAPLILMDVHSANRVYYGCGAQAGDLSKHSETRIKEIEEEIKALDKELVSCFWPLTWRAAALRRNFLDLTVELIRLFYFLPNDDV